MPLRLAAYLGVVMATILSCRGTVDAPRREPHAEAIRPGENCARSSVATGEVCPQRDVPASNASSPEGCHSDADCKQGMNGRCIDTGSREPSGHARWGGNLFGAAPPPPPRTVCVYDACFKDADCGPKQRCECGGEVGRNYCLAIDDCTTDAACGGNRICQCGSSVGSANYCVGGNCRGDADCHDGLKCDSGMTGTFCRTASDVCHSNEDCPRLPNASNTCGYLVERSRWECQAIPYPPPG